MVGPLILLLGASLIPFAALTDLHPVTSSVECLEEEFACADGLKCIPVSWKCDYSPDCLDASDEPSDCPEAPCGMFRCSVSGKCLPQGWVCDGEADCGIGDTSDEDNHSCKKGNTCSLNYFRCKNDIDCVLVKQLCDGSNDCPDSSDEGDFCNETAQCQSLNCEYQCKPTDKGPQCFCPEGQQPNGTSCVDSNECEVEGSCDQSCTNLENNYTCSCSEGYDLIGKSICRAINNPPGRPATLLYTSNSGLAHLFLNGTALPGNSHFNSHHAITFDFNHRNNSVCWVSSNTSWSVFKCAAADNLEESWVIPQPSQNGLNYVHDIARDWVTGNWYILDRREMIFMCNATMQVCITLMDVFLSEPRGIALDPSSGYMFFTNWGTTDPKLERALMDGTKRQGIVLTKIVYPFGVTLDYPNKHVYWVDGYLSHVERVDYNGDNRRIIIKLKTDERPFGISLFENSLFVTSWKDDTIKRINKFHTHNVSTFHTNLTEPMHIHVFHHQRQPNVEHPCGVYNGGCQHICIPLWKDGLAVASCHCQPGHILGPGGSCVAHEHEAFLIYAKGRPGMIKGVALDKAGSSEVMVPITSLTRPTTLDYDVHSQFIYYADIQRFVIERQSLDGTKREEVVTSAVLNVEGLAVDWMARNIYWTDEGVSSIFVCSMENPEKRKMLLHGNLTNARAIVLNPGEGFMYWTVWQFTIGGVIAGGDGLIERAWMDGTHREPFVTKELQWPNGLTIDFKERHLYWCDGFHNKIERIGLDGKNREVMLRGDVLNHPYGLAYYNGFIYWSEFQNGTIKRVKLHSQDSPEELRIENPYIFDLKIFSNTSQNDTNECTEGHLQCVDLCLATPNGPVCACATGYEPDGQQKNLCNPITNFTQPSLCSEGQFQCKKNLRCIDERYLCDGDNDCLDNSDEDTSPGGVCEAAQCHKDMFQCGNNQCIDAFWVCDDDRDCEDGSDESPEECNHPLCPADKFRCQVSRRCIAQSWVCDIDKDCGSGDDSDEHAACEYQECSLEDFKCGNKRCVPMFYVCDGDDDCRDNTDEKMCDTFCANATAAGLPATPFCNNICLNITQQTTCQETQGCTYCGSNNTCIAAYQLCDGVLNCPDGSDESRCDEKILQGCRPEEYMCERTRECIHQSLKCDGNDDCLDRSDELGCESIECSHSEWKCTSVEYCIPDIWKCDGVEDCIDSSDEKMCPSIPIKCTPPSHVCDNSTVCVLPASLCDGHKNCKDGSDEGGRCGSFDCQLMDCHKNCTQGPGGPVCTCPKGQTLLPDGRMCSDLHPCQQWGTCSQECVPTKHSHKCVCIDGYQIEPDHFTCKSTDPAVPYLIFSNRHELRSIILKDNSMGVKALISSLKNTIALDFYHSDEGDVIFWTDVVDDKIYRGTLLAGALSNIEVVVQTGLATAEGLAVDWLAENLYWVESNLDQIEVAKLNGSYRRTLIASRMESPRAISLDPRVGMVFWSDWEEGKARIESCSMSGEGRRVVIVVSEIIGGGWPNGLTLDYALRRIYWIDAKSDSIHTSFYDGSDHREILRDHHLLSHPFAISLFGNYVYWTDWRTNSVIRANKFNGSDIRDIQRTITQPFDIQVLHPSRQPRDAPNPCKEENGGCSHLCLLSFNGTYQCNCPHIMSLGPDNKTCIRNEKVLLFSRPNEIRGVDLNKPTHDIIPRISLPKVQHATQLDFVAKTKKIYWADSNMNEVKRGSLTGTPIETVIDTALPAPRGFAIDWLSNNLFVTSSSSKSKQINVATVNGEFLIPVIMNLSDPISLAVDPYGGRIFWSDIGGDFHTVHMATMTGSNVTLLSSHENNEYLDHPRSLTYDPLSQRLYWVNIGSNSIQYFDLVKETTFNLPTFGNSSKPEALTVYMNFVYYSDGSNSSIYKMDKTIGSKRELVRSGLDNFLSLKIYDESIQDGSNACSQDSRPCAHLCLPKNRVERECRCAIGYKVDERDPTTCVAVDGVLIYSTSVGLSGLSVDTPVTEKGENLELLTPISEIGTATCLDFHAEQDLLVWADGDQGTITSIQRDGTNRHVIVEGADVIQGIAVDWVANNLYWTNPKADVIEMCRLNGSDHFVIIASGLEKPGAIAVHPGSGYMFWADTGEKARIERANLDGSNRTVLVNTSLQFPADLVVDFEEGHLYWVDQWAKSVERVNLDGSERTTVLNSSVLQLPVATYVFNNNIYWADMVYGGGSVRSASTLDLTRISTLRSGLGDTVKDIIIMGNDVQIGINPCADNNGGCSEICLFTGVRARCQCYHARVAKDGKSCVDHEAFLMFSSINSIESIHMFDENNPNTPLKRITSDFMKNAISLTFDYASKRLYYSDIQRGSINTVHFNGSNHAILVERQGAVEGLAFEEKERDLYWTCQSDATINRMSVDPSRTKRVEKIVHLSAADKPRGIVVDSCDLQIYWTNWNSEAPSIQRSLVSGIRVESIVTTLIKMPNGLAIDHMAQKLYWGDARLDKIERCNLDGSDRVILLKNVPSHPFDLAIYGDYIFWTDWVLHAVVRANKYTSEDVVKLRTGVTRLMGIVAVANDTNACDASPCRVLNGGCEDICSLDERAQAVCRCSPGRTLLADGRRCAVHVANCTSDQFECSSGFCIPYIYSCDGVPECPDSSDEDEKYCVRRTCREGYFACGNGPCVPQETVCDRHANCPNFRDENDCDCKEDEIKCETSGLCIAANLKCDNDPDCPDASDEMGCEKRDCTAVIWDGFNSSELINCANTTNCIHPKWICDGANDCWDNSDEQNCATITVPVESSSCPSGTHQCRNGRCVAALFICDGDNDCKDGNATTLSSDEASCNRTCPDDQFTCVDGNCIPSIWQCDAHKDCPDGSDEPNDCVTKACEEDQFKCNTSGRCILQKWVCDGDNDCGDGASDESPPEGCPLPLGIACPPPQFLCPLLNQYEHRCLPAEYHCDGHEDCWDGSDEPDSCPPHVCLDSQFKCNNGKCVPSVWVCNGRNDCSDSSDEANCTANVTTLGDSGCSEGEYKCNNGICVALNNLCNGHDDCGDYSDEQLCNINECEKINPRVCAHKCVDKAIGYACQCDEGYAINPNDSKLCVDIDECADYPCPHFCHNTLGSYKCMCAPDYISEQNSHKCRANSTVKPKLIFTNRYYIREVNIDGTNSRLLVANLTNAVGLDYDFVENCIYWSDVTHLSSSVKKMCNNSQPMVLHSAVQSPDGIALDWVGRNLYWCDKGKDTIEVSKLDGRYRKVLINKGLQDPRAIVLDPFHGNMYWTDWGNQPHIGKAGMDGSMQRIIVNSSLGWPNALTISYVTKELFWADAHQDYIAHSDLDGNNIRTIRNRDTAPKHVQHIFAITVFEDYLYWTDWELKSVLRAEKYTGKDIQNIYNAIHRPMDIHVYHPFRQQPLKNNPCQGGGGCDTMCLLAPEGPSGPVGKTCTCPENFKLGSDGVSCESNCLSSMFVCNSTYKCIPFWWKCDTQDDCGDNSDEPENCPDYSCTPGQFQCDNGNCIHPSLICDNQDHCKDGSDEPNCDQYSCVLSQFKCPAFNGSSAFCIAVSRRCDGTPDCNDGSDEKECPAPSCSSDWFSCNNTQCIPKVWVCDGEQDCSDHSDEMPECSTRQCPPENFRCKNGRCIPRSWKCDGEFDCPGREDEGDDCYQTHTCDDSQFKCDSMKCIPSRWKCDGENDCLDASDEKGCPERNCSESEFRCDDGRCIAKKYHCDGSTNCADGSDEAKCEVHCSENMFKCSTIPQCILKDWVCDKDPDCSDESDERNCSSTCGPGFTRCDNGTCVFDSWVCDGENDCADGSDESKEQCANHSCSAGKFRCKNNLCIMESHVCDGEDHCHDGSDEALELCQRKKVCGSGQFQCKNGHCIGKASVCDGFDDCVDDSDEENCPQGCRFGECSQVCNVKKDGNHTCSCAPGYSLHSYSQKNQKSCFADGNLAYMVLANDNHLRKLSPYKHGNSASILTLTEEDSKVTRVHSVDVLYGQEPRAFWTNLHDNTLVSMSVPTTHEEYSSRVRREASPLTVLLRNLKKPRGVAVDWVTGLVYVVNAGDRTILAVSLDGSKKITLISTGLEQTQDIVVDPQSGQLFWTDWGFSPGIDVAGMDGQNKKRLLDRNILGPVGLAIDYPTRRLYWADIKTNRIETVMLDGSDRHVVKQFAPGEGVPSNLDIFEDMVYFITHDTNTVYRLNKFGYRNHEMSRISQHSIKISDVLIVQEKKQDKLLFNPCAGNPCDADAMCLISGPKNYSCLCPDGLTEEIVEGVKKCHVKPSKETECPLFCNKGECIQTQTGPRCQCQPMYQGLHCEKYRCSGYCKNNGQCAVDTEKDEAAGVPILKCICGPKWKGERCETPVKTCDNFCQNNGSCKLTKDNVPYCICPRKFTGDQCEQCKDLQCENGGICRLRMMKGTQQSFCTCYEGYHGSNCSHSLCTGYCKQGSCRIMQDFPHCTCHNGWSGRVCDTCIDKAACEDPCADLVCENEGKCTIFPGLPRQAKCSCAPGYHGEHCQMSICYNYCVNGFCQIRRGFPACECDRGWSGPRCSVPNCQDGGANCGCPLGYHGPNCDHFVCENYCLKGECQLVGEDPECKCPPGYSGDRCQKNDCDHFCHRGTCRTTPDGVTCDCEEGYTGPQCKEPIPGSRSCLPNPCENGATCVIIDDKQLCRCATGYVGNRCQTYYGASRDPCSTWTCLHGGVCQVQFGNPICICNHEWTGENCGLQKVCNESLCFNGGVCSTNPDPSLQPICNCPKGYMGLRCETQEDVTADRVEKESVPNTATVVIGVFVAIVVLVVAVVVAWLWQHQRGQGISHVRLEENGGTVEMTNPMYLHASDDQEDNPNPIFTLHDSPNTFKNPVYDSLYSEEAATSITQEEKTGLLQSDPLGALDTSRSTGSKS